MYELVYNFGEYSEASKVLRRLERRFNIIPRCRKDGFALQIDPDRVKGVQDFVKAEYGLDPIREGEDTR